jgi:hypothetical protein
LSNPDNRRLQLKIPVVPRGGGPAILPPSVYEAARQRLPDWWEIISRAKKCSCYDDSEIPIRGGMKTRFAFRPGRLLFGIKY